MWFKKRKKELLPFAKAWMELESMLSERSQAVRDKHHMLSLRNLMNKQNK